MLRLGGMRNSYDFVYIIYNKVQEPCLLGVIEIIEKIEPDRDYIIEKLEVL